MRTRIPGCAITILQDQRFGGDWRSGVQVAVDFWGEPFVALPAEGGLGPGRFVGDGTGCAARRRNGRSRSSRPLESHARRAGSHAPRVHRAPRGKEKRERPFRGLPLPVGPLHPLNVPRRHRETMPLLQMTWWCKLSVKLLGQPPPRNQDHRTLLVFALPARHP